MLMKYIPVFKGADFFPHDLRLPFMSYKGVALAASRGRTMFAFDCDRPICLQYAHGGTGLEGRVIFPDSEPTDPFAGVKTYTFSSTAASNGEIDLTVNFERIGVTGYGCLSYAANLKVDGYAVVDVCILRCPYCK